MDFKKLIELIESGFDDVQIADAIEFLGDKSASMAELEHDNHMHAIKIERLQAEIDALKADKEQQHMQVTACRTRIASGS